MTRRAEDSEALAAAGEEFRRDRGSLCKGPCALEIAAGDRSRRQGPGRRSIRPKQGGSFGLIPLLQTHGLIVASRNGEEDEQWGSAPHGRTSVTASPSPTSVVRGPASDCTVTHTSTSDPTPTPSASGIALSTAIEREE